MNLFKAMAVAFVVVFSSTRPEQAIAQKLSDTIFYNDQWEICEKPIASFYRLGTLAIDSFWFFIGPVKDYNIDNDSLVMDGLYSQDGYKNGRFTFNYPDGKPAAIGYYVNDRMSGTWQYYYRGGGGKATVWFSGEPGEYHFIKYSTEKGEVTLENGSGSFVWRRHELEDQHENDMEYAVKGEFKDSLRNGTWKYYIGPDMNITTITNKENYHKGKLSKAVSVGYFGKEKIKEVNIRFNFDPEKIRTTEKITRDIFFTKYDSSGKRNDASLVNYLIEGESPEITLKEKEFAKSFATVIGTLDKYRNRIDYQDKEIEGKVEFWLSDKGTPERVTVTGNITQKEKNFISYVMGKFSHMEMPSIDSTIALEGYHTLYFFTYSPRKFSPSEIWSYIPRTDFAFSPVPRDRFLLHAKESKKAMRKMLNRL